MSSARPDPPPDLRALVGGDEAIVSFRLEGPESAPLTVAESEVATALLAGKSNAEIARERGTRPRTIANQVASILKKLGMRSRGDVIGRLAGTNK